MEAGKPNLPERIKHPAHQSLVLCTYDEVRAKYGDSTSSCCSLCRNKFEEGDYVYACDISPHVGCAFTLDTACSSIKAEVHFRGHDHRLYFLERVNPSGSQKCQSCKGYTEEHLFRCCKDGCDYSLHLSCGPLLVAVRYHHSGHKLTLTLKDALLDGAYLEDSWCDICEEQRDPMKCVYRSEDPPFTATIDCILHQIVGALKGDHGEVKLRTVKHHIPGKDIVTAQGSTDQDSGEEKSAPHGDPEEVIEIDAADVEDDLDLTFHGEEIITFDAGNIFDSLTEEDQELIWRSASELKKRGLLEVRDLVIPFKFSDAAFEQFKEHTIIGAVDISSMISVRRFQGEIPLVKVGSNSVLPELVPLYLQVIDKHGDFTAGSPLSPIGKAILTSMLLAIIQVTRGLQICEITGDLLCTLQFSLKFVGENFGFDVQFALDNLEKLARACYALKFVKARDDITTGLTRKIEQLERDIPEDKPKIEALKEQYRGGKESAFVKQCLAEASTLKWKNAGELLGMDPEIINVLEKTIFI